MKSLSNIFKSQKYVYFYVFMLVIFLVNCILQAGQANSKLAEVSQKIDLGLQIFFSISILLKFVQYEQQQAFWMVLDIGTNICGYLAFGLGKEGGQGQASRYLRSLKTLRLLLIVKESSYLKVPASNLISSLSSVGKILLPAAMFIYFYAVIGLYSFRDYEYSRCRDPSNKMLNGNWSVYDEQVFLCGQKKCPQVGGVQYECLNPIDFGVQPNEEQAYNIMQGNGLMKYDNIFYSLFSTFKQTFITGSSRIMLLNKQVLHYLYVLVYYLSFIYLLAYIYLNIIYGLMMSNEEEDVMERRDSSFQLKLQDEARLSNEGLVPTKQEEIDFKRINTSVYKKHRNSRFSINSSDGNNRNLGMSVQSPSVNKRSIDKNLRMSAQSPNINKRNTANHRMSALLAEEGNKIPA